MIEILAIIGLTFFLKETEGPFGIMSNLRSLLYRNKYVGVFFYKLFDCAFCLGCHSGYIVYLLTHTFVWQHFILWIFMGGIVSYFSFLLMDFIINKNNVN